MGLVQMSAREEEDSAYFVGYSAEMSRDPEDGV